MDRDIALRMVTALTGISNVVLVISNNATPSVPAPDNRDINLNMIYINENQRTETESEQDPEPEEIREQDPEPVTKEQK